jgi:hypothetical protein
MNTATIEREAPSATSQNLFSVECDEPLERKQKYKAKILEERYKAEIEDALARRLAYVKAGKGRITIGLQDESGKDVGKLIDTGDRIAASTGSDQEIQAMIDLAKAKGWKNIKFTGSDDFRQRASQAAVDAGFEIKGYKPKLKPEPEQSASVLDALAELTGETPPQSVPDPHEQARLAARKRAQDELDRPRVDQVLPEPLEAPEMPSGDPYMLACCAEIQRIQGEIDKAKEELAKIKTHDVAAIQQAALAAAQDDPRNSYIMDPVRRLHAKRHATESQLAHEQKRHAARGWLAKATNAGKLAFLERAAAEAKGEHLSVAKVVRKKLMESEMVRGPMKIAEYENQRHATLTDQVKRLGYEAQDLRTVELRLRSAGGDGKKMLQSIQLGRALDAAEQRVLDLVRSQEKAKRHADQLAEKLARQERQRELAKAQELEVPELEEQHQTPRPN